MRCLRLECRGTVFATSFPSNPPEAEDPHGSLARALAFLGVTEVAPSIIDAAVRFGGFDNMLTMSKEGRYNKCILGAGAP